MSAEKSTSIELFELIGNCSKTADQLWRRENCMLMVRDALYKMRPALRIEMKAIEAIQVSSSIMNSMNL